MRLVQICYDVRKSTKENYVPLFYEAANTPNITPDKMSLRTLYHVVEQEIETAKKKNGRTLELTALGVGAWTIGGKTYVAIGFELTNTTPQN